ncbi:hypothetical protein RGUI_0961 [Rhodovulum sp. P5]|uniref:quinoprotein dehydrogenase-associated SoxYZ-like carrier n=1 Tax=Rhodovulum sp. P5 TaxID=1564506 RepID=UPI0009C1BCA7|nr:quinoprotein dehydrogenase-associated SoxYZ-like carrier [Rhodovulum sp. P5]ARE39102.1 hypothetical protein RGUI_0961 [Rhodovulum sp. P5]
MKSALAAALTALALSPGLATGGEISNPMTDSPIWSDLKGYILGEDVVTADGSAVFDIDAPYRAHDAATVPVVIHQTDPSVRIKSARLVIDENPAPLAATITFGPAMAPIDMELRVRVNQYSNIRVIADTDRGLLMTGRFVKASGGCSAPATKDPEKALAGMGQMMLRTFPAQGAMSTPRREAQIMIRHPNYSGLQRDPISQLFIAAHFIDLLEVWQGDEMLFTVEGGISVSENPVFRFSYSDNGAPDLRVVAHDTEGNRFERTLEKAGSI